MAAIFGLASVPGGLAVPLIGAWQPHPTAPWMERRRDNVLILRPALDGLGAPDPVEETLTEPGVVVRGEDLSAPQARHRTAAGSRRTNPPQFGQRMRRYRMIAHRKKRAARCRIKSASA